MRRPDAKRPQSQETRPAEQASSTVRRALSPLFNAFPYLVRRIDRAMGLYFNENTRPLGLTPTQMSVLAVVVLAPGLEQAEVGDLANSDPATTGSVIARLEKLGAVRRARSRRSRRGWAVTPTPEGSDLITQSFDSIEKIEREMLSCLSPDERLVLLRLLSKVARVSNSFNDS